VRPIREISVLRGFDSKEHVLAVFGGAGPQHACAIARSLGIGEIFIHRFAGILSAYGMGLADVVVERQKPASAVYGPETLSALKEEITALTQSALDELARQGFNADRVEAKTYLNLRYDGTDTALMISAPADGDYAGRLSTHYRREFGFDLTDRAIMVDDIRVRAGAAPPACDRPSCPRPQTRPRNPWKPSPAISTGAGGTPRSSTWGGSRPAIASPDRPSLSMTLPLF